MAFDPPPSFLENYIANFLEWIQSLQKLAAPFMVAYMQVGMRARKYAHDFQRSGLF